jgi:UDP-sulfoquinovose synthase
MMKVLVMGGDGFCGWAAALHLAKNNHQVLIVDDLSRRKIDTELSINSLTPIESIEKRIEVANELIGNIDFIYVDVAKEYDKFHGIVDKFRPDTIVHFAEQRAAPYSMISQKERRYTIENNISATHNILSIIVDVDPDIHLVHLGTMGVYGYNDRFGEIPEGYLDVTINQTGCGESIVYPASPGSIYHLTKVMDHDMLQYYNSNWNLKITDLHQGVIWGTDTEETKLDERLINRFDYDGDYGTVINRFLMQSVIGHPLTVYGTGGQTRALIHISDMAKCIKIAIESPPKNQEKVRIFNQISETIQLRDLAKTISEYTDVKVQYIDNPRNELSENKLFVKNDGLKSLGFDPIYLKDGLFDEIRNIVEKYKDRVIKEKILPKTLWK